jgi:diaminohydroxyphosphoribosylaminopyrimidine deaminase / 5-amino-6-(5-phosphoribosylamino)uracil reductase
VISTLDRLLLQRAYELASRGIGNTSPNPPVGAVVARCDEILGEGFHHRAGDAHAETNALATAGDARGATLYVSLEPCTLTGRTPPCASAVLDAGIARVVVGTNDPTGNGGGAETLRAAGVEVEIAGDARARSLIEIFATSVKRDRPYVALKMAMSLDGCVTSRPGVAEWITSDDARGFVRDLRIAHDAVLVGAGTVRVDDPQLTVRPPASRLRAFRRVVACERDTVPLDRRIFADVRGYDPTIVLAPAGAKKRFAPLERVAEVVYVGADHDHALDLERALQALRERDIFSVLCEGGPTLAARLLARGLVDRLYWVVAPLVIGSADAVPVLARGKTDGARRFTFDGVERVGNDAVLSGTFADV